MQIRYDFQDFVLSRSFKYYTFNMQKQRIEEFRQLDAREMNSLVSHWHSFGFRNKEEATRAVEGIMQQSDWAGAWERVDNISCLNLNEGTTIEMEVDFDKKVRLLYLGNFTFFVCRDDSGFLQYGDILIDLIGGISCQQIVYFCATRDGQPFPKSSTAVVFTPQTLRRSIGIMVEQSSVQPMNESNLSLPFVYVWRACSDKHGHVWFSEEQLTDNQDAAFRLDLTKGSFSLNEQLNLRTYNDEGVNLIKDVLKMLSVADGNDWSAIRLSRLFTQEEGCFVLDAKQSVLMVTKRITISSNQLSSK